MDLFKKIDFVSSNGINLTWKIDCDALTDNDIETLAYIISEKLKFKKVIGIPTGGLRLASSLDKYKIDDEKLPVLIVDDVLTTGGSMEKMKQKYQNQECIGVVIFSRGTCGKWITTIFNMEL